MASPLSLNLGKPLLAPNYETGHKKLKYCYGKLNVDMCLYYNFLYIIFCSLLFRFNYVIKEVWLVSIVFTIEISSLGQTLSTFHYTLLDKCRALLSVVERGWPNALDFSLDLELNIPRMYYLMNNSFMECFVHYLMNSNCTCARSTTLDNFALDQTSLDKKQSSRLHSTRWPNALDIHSTCMSSVV